MAKTTLKIVERKTTVPREKIREAFLAAADVKAGSSLQQPKSDMSQKTDTKTKS